MKTDSQSASAQKLRTINCGMSETKTISARVINSAEEIRAVVLAAKNSGQSVGFVPTMGALHAGHLSLIDASVTESDLTVVSIFVNPTQFSPEEDLEKYPRPLDRDIQLLTERGCELVFVPTSAEMYPEGIESTVEVGPVAAPFEGVSRPHHFRGVATVVSKLFQMVPADRVYFGRKDYQQTLVVGQLIEELNLPITMRVCPIVREPDGLAMSSRNTYLRSEQRLQAGALWQSLQLAEQSYAAGETDVIAIKKKMMQYLNRAGIDDIEYIAFVADGTVREVGTITGPTVAVIAVRFGEFRLIDNHTFG